MPAFLPTSFHRLKNLKPRCFRKNSGAFRFQDLLRVIAKVIY